MVLLGFFLIGLMTLLATVLGDMGFYRDTNSHYMGLDYPDLLKIPILYAEVTTSQSSLAGTNDDILATFIGEFSSSGPHHLGSFVQGTTVLVPITLQREIGILKTVIFATKGTDGWLLSKLNCRVNNVKYDLDGPIQWVDSFDPLQFELYQNGYEPDSQDPSILASSTLKLQVKKTSFIYSAKGLIDIV